MIAARAQAGLLDDYLSSLFGVRHTIRCLPRAAARTNSSGGVTPRRWRSSRVPFDLAQGKRKALATPPPPPIRSGYGVPSGAQRAQSRGITCSSPRNIAAPDLAFHQPSLNNRSEWREAAAPIGQSH